MKRKKTPALPARRHVTHRINRQLWKSLRAFARAERLTTEQIIESALVSFLREHTTCEQPTN